MNANDESQADMDGDDEGDQIAWRYHAKTGPAHGYLKSSSWSLCSMASWVTDQDNVDSERRLCGLCVNVAGARKLRVRKCALKGCNGRESSWHAPIVGHRSWRWPGMLRSQWRPKMDLEELRKAALEGAFATKTIQCFGCYSTIEVPLTTNAIGLCKRCPEKSGWVRVSSADKCQMPCPDPIDYMKDVDGRSRVGYCRKHTIELCHASIDAPLLPAANFGPCGFCHEPGVEYRLEGTPGKVEYVMFCSQCVQDRVPVGVSVKVALPGENDGP